MSPPFVFNRSALDPKISPIRKVPAAGGFTREVFTVVDSLGLDWQVPTGVTQLDFLCVGGGAHSDVGTDSSQIVPIYGGGGAGGSVRVQLGVAVNPGDMLKIFVGSGGGSGSLVRNTTQGNITIASSGDSGAGGVSLDGSSPPDGGNGSVFGGPGGGSGWLDGMGPGTPGTGANGAGNGGSASNVGGTALGDVVNNASGGGGGAGGNGTNATGNANPGDGGPGIIPSAHSFGAWGTDIGENGFFGGGGWGCELVNPPLILGDPGIGNGAENTGGGSGVATDGSIPEGRSGIVCLVYANP